MNKFFGAEYEPKNILMNPVHVHACLDVNKEIDKLRKFHQKALECVEESSAARKRLDIERKLRRDAKRSIEQQNDINRNRFDRIPEAELRDIFLDPTQLSSANKIFDSKETSSAKRDKSASLEQNEVKSSTFEDASPWSIDAHETKSSPEVRIDSLLKNTALVQSLLNVNVKGGDLEQPHFFQKRKKANSQSQHFTVTRKEGNASFIQENVDNKETHKDADVYLDSMKEFGSAMQDLLGVMKPLINDFKNHPEFKANSQHLKNKDKGMRYKKKTASKRPSQLQSQLNHSNGPSPFKTTSLLNNNEVASKQSENKQPRKGKPKALKRMQKIAKDHNL